MTRTTWRRAFAFTTASLFVLSWIFPLAAGLTKDKTSLPTWWGPVDVALAFVLAISAFGIQGLVREEVDKQAKETTYRFYRISTHAILAVGAVVMLAGGRIAWANCETGFLWRTWLLLYILRGGLRPHAAPRFVPLLEIGCKPNSVRTASGSSNPETDCLPVARSISEWPVIRPRFETRFRQTRKP